MKKIHFFIFILLAAVSGTAAGLLHIETKPFQSNYRIYAQASMKYSDLNSILESADLIVTGVVTDVEHHETYSKYIVNVNKKNKGDCTSEIFVYNYFYDYTYAVDNTIKAGRTHTEYVTGEEYIFILQHIRNVYEDKYVILSDSYFPTSSPQNFSYLAEELTENIDYVQYIEQYTCDISDGLGDELSIEYIESPEELDILAQSEYIAIIEVNTLYHSTEVIDVYSCTIKETLKGDLTTTSENAIIVPFFKNTVNPDTQYIVCLASETKDSLIYTLSSKNSVFTIDRTDEIKSIVTE